jgi:hypothetical protein
MKTQTEQHTPGPWTAEPEEASEGRGIAICGKDAIVATILPAEGGPGLDDTDRANAALIAQAPALLAERDRLGAINADLLQALYEVDSNAAESPEWIRHRTRPAIEAAQAYNRERIAKEATR